MYLNVLTHDHIPKAMFIIKKVINNVGKSGKMW